MAIKKSLRYLRQPAITAVILIALALVVVIASPTLRSRLSSSLGSSANLFLFDDQFDDDTSEIATGEAGASPDGKAVVRAEGKKSNGFKRAVTAPVRLFARLFSGKNNNDMAIKKASEKDLEKNRVVTEDPPEKRGRGGRGRGPPPESAHRRDRLEKSLRRSGRAAR